MADSTVTIAKVSLSPLGLKFALQASDYQAFQAHLQRHGSVVARPSRLESLLRASVIFIPILLLGVLAIWKDIPGIPSGYSVALVAGVVFALLLLPLLAYIKVLGKRYQPEDDGFSLVRRSYKLHSEGVRCVTPRGMSQHRWHHFRGWEATGSAYYLYLDTAIAHILPRRVLTDAQEIELQHWLNTGIGAPAKLVPPSEKKKITPHTSAVAPTAQPETSTEATDTHIKAVFSHNLLSGFQVLIWPLRRFRIDDNQAWEPIPSTTQSLLFFLIFGSLLCFSQYLQIANNPQFSLWGAASTASMGIASLVFLTVASIVSSRQLRFGHLLTLIGATSIWCYVGILLLNWLRSDTPVLGWMNHSSYSGLVVFWVGYVCWASITRGLSLTPLKALSLTLALIIALGLIWRVVHPSPLWYEFRDYERESSKVDVEALYYQQGRLLNDTVSAIERHVPNQTDLFFVGFANDGSEGVFAHETRYAQQLFDTQFNTKNRSTALLNDYDSLSTTPLANAPNLKALLRDLAAKMDTREDVLVMYLTSHGSQDAELHASLWPAQPKGLSAEQLKQALDEAGIRWRILIVVGCYTGSFIPILADENSLIMTASAADRVSFGCGVGRDFTYFGDALLRHGLKDNQNLLTAFDIASEKVGEWERAEGEKESHPQIYAGNAITSRLEELQTQSETKTEP